MLYISVPTSRVVAENRLPEASGSDNPLIDLLSGDNIGPSQAVDSLAIVLVEEIQSNDATPQQNALALVDMFSVSNASTMQQPQNNQILEEQQQPPLQVNGKYSTGIYRHSTRFRQSTVSHSACLSLTYKA